MIMRTSLTLLICGLLGIVLNTSIVLSKNQHVVLSGRYLSVDKEAFIVKGVCWNPVAAGESFPSGLPWFQRDWNESLSSQERALIAQDLQLMQQAGINTVRTYEPIVNLETLELLANYHIFQIVPVYSFYKKNHENIRSVVNQLKDHPTTLFWELGNEWNYNRLYSEGEERLTLEVVAHRLLEAANIVRQLDPYHPISTSYGDLPIPSKDAVGHPELLSLGDFKELDKAVDIWGLNVYSRDTFRNDEGVSRANIMADLTQKPIYFSEYGADAFNSHSRSVDEISQSDATRKLTEEITQDLVWMRKGGNVLGGTIFEFSDEWWKAPGSNDRQDDGGHAPGNGPYPDGVFNEEYWGLMTIDRQAREAYFELAKIYQSLP